MGASALLPLACAESWAEPRCHRYGSEQGRGDLREALCARYYAAHGRSADEIFVSDGSKCDIGRMQVHSSEAVQLTDLLEADERAVQMMFGAGVSVAVQDPSYPVYVDSSVIMGMTQGYEQSHGGYDSIQYMVCRPETGFFPDLSSVRASSLAVQRRTSTRSSSPHGTAYTCLAGVRPQN